MVDKKIKIYLCGPTVYGSSHIGNLRPIIIFDLMIRSLRFLNLKVILIHNITDIDDKIIAQAKKENLSEKMIASKYLNQYLNLLKIFNVEKPTYMPRVVDNILTIIKFIQKLIALDYAYVVEGSVFFRVLKVKNYGSVSGQKIDWLTSSQDHSLKEYSGDFALWKKTIVGLKFKSPWSDGRPGWHTECVSLIDKLVQGQLDYHGGGIDLIFPHHENENAQYYGLYKKAITKKWLHVGHLNWEQNKMSKSLGNLILAKDFAQLYGQDTLRILFLITNPTSPLSVNLNLIQQAKIQVQKWEHIFKQALWANYLNPKTFKDQKIMQKIAIKISRWEFNFALTIIYQQLKQFQKKSNNGLTIIKIMQLLGFNFSQIKITKSDYLLYKKWEELKTNHHFKEADKLRLKLIKKKLI